MSRKEVLSEIESLKDELRTDFPDRVVLYERLEKLQATLIEVPDEELYVCREPLLERISICVGLIKKKLASEKFSDKGMEEDL